MLANDLRELLIASEELWRLKAENVWFFLSLTSDYIEYNE